MWGEPYEPEHYDACLSERCPECGARDLGPTTRLQRRLIGPHAHRRRRTIRIRPAWCCLWCSYAAPRWYFDSTDQPCICQDILESDLDAQAEAAVDWGYGYAD